ATENLIVSQKLRDFSASQLAVDLQPLVTSSPDFGPWTLDFGPPAHSVFRNPQSACGDHAVPHLASPDFPSPSPPTKITAMDARSAAFDPYQPYRKTLL